MRALTQFAITPMSVERAPMALSEAILLGSTKHPQHFGGWTNKTWDATCALFAAVDAIGLLDQVRNMEPGIGLRFEDLWPIVTTWGSCPVCHSGQYLGNLVIHLTDDHHWTRPRIAEYVRGIETQQHVQAVTQPEIVETVA